MGAVILCQVPDAHATRPVAADDLALIRVDNDVVCGASVIVASLNRARACFPNLNRAIFGAGDHPFALTMERNSSDVARVAFKGQEGIRVRGFDVVEFDRVMARGGEEALVWRDA